MTKKKIYAYCEQNVCPVCGSADINYGNREDCDTGALYPWTCEKCGATGKESYTETFDGNHCDVHLKNGTPVEIVIPPSTPSENMVCPVCSGTLEYTGNNGETKYGICQEWRCTSCRATGWAKFEEETEYIFNGEHEDVRLEDGSEWDGEEINHPQEPVVAAEDDDIPWYPSTESPTGNIILLNAWDMEAAMAALHKANICAKEENSMIYVSQAPVEQAVKVLCEEGILLQAVTYAGNTAPTVIPPAPDKAADGWFVPVTWEKFGVVRIPFDVAPTLAEAFKQVKDNPDIALPKGHYVDDSFAPSYELEQIEEVRSAYNDNRPDQEVSV